jgi:chromosome segregation ATPase
MINTLLQEHIIENSNFTESPEIMSAYTVNTSAFEAVMEREFTSYLKNMSKLGLLSTSIKACRAAIATGVAVEVKAKKSTGRPKKAPKRKVSDADIIDDMVAKANSKPKKVRKPKMTAEEKAAKKEAAALVKAELKAEKAEKAAILKAEKKAATDLAKAEKKAAKALEATQLKAEKAAKKEALKAEKAALRTQIEADNAEKNLLEKEAKALEKAKQKAEKLAAREQEKAAKKAASAELRAVKKAEKKASKKAEDERKKNEALALMAAAVAECAQNDVPILNEAGDVVGSKVEGFNLPEENELELEVETGPMGFPAGYKIFTHDSREGEKLVIDEVTKNVFKEDGEHIGQLDSDGTLLECDDSSDSSDSEEEAFPEM